VRRRIIELTLRASQGGDQVVTLPKDVELLGVSRDGQALNLRLLDGKLSLPVVPGSQTLRGAFRDADGGGIQRAHAGDRARIACGQRCADLQLPADRWLLATFGPPVGPAVLYWGELIVMIALACGLARTRRTRLTLRDWLLLRLGFSTFSWIALLVVVAWLFAIRLACPFRLCLRCAGNSTFSRSCCAADTGGARLSGLGYTARACSASRTCMSPATVRPRSRCIGSPIEAPMPCRRPARSACRCGYTKC
jgi:hypothetical protein